MTESLAPLHPQPAFPQAIQRRHPQPQRAWRPMRRGEPHQPRQRDRHRGCCRARTHLPLEPRRQERPHQANHRVPRYGSQQTNSSHPPHPPIRSVSGFPSAPERRASRSATAAHQPPRAEGRQAHASGNCQRSEQAPGLHSGMHTGTYRDRARPQPLLTGDEPQLDLLDAVFERWPWAFNARAGGHASSR